MRHLLNRGSAAKSSLLSESLQQQSSKHIRRRSVILFSAFPYSIHGFSRDADFYDFGVSHTRKVTEDNLSVQEIFQA
jgi:hypothetical protein